MKPACKQPSRRKKEKSDHSRLFSSSLINQVRICWVRSEVIIKQTFLSKTCWLKSLIHDRHRRTNQMLKVKCWKTMRLSNTKKAQIGHDLWPFHPMIQRKFHIPYPISEPVWRGCQPTSYAHGICVWKSPKGPFKAYFLYHHTNASKKEHLS